MMPSNVWAWFLEHWASMSFSWWKQQMENNGSQLLWSGRTPWTNMNGEVSLVLYLPGIIFIILAECLIAEYQHGWHIFSQWGRRVTAYGPWSSDGTQLILLPTGVPLDLKWLTNFRSGGTNKCNCQITSRHSHTKTDMQGFLLPPGTPWMLLWYRRGEEI